MNLKQNFRRTCGLSIAALAIGLMAAPACKKDKEGAGGGSGGAAVASGSMKVFPADSEFVFGVNGPKLRKSKYFDMLQGLIKQKGGDELARLEACGLDVLHDFEAITAAGNTKTGKPLLQAKGIAREAFKKCAGASEKVQLKEEGEFSVLSGDGEDKVFAWIGDNTVIGGPDWSKADLKARLTADSGVEANKPLAELLGKTDSGAAIWFAYAPAGGKMPGNAPVDVRGLYGSVWLDNGIKLDIGTKLGTEKEASDIVAQAKAQLPQAKAQFKAFGPLIDKLDFSSSGSVVRVKLDLSYTEVDDLVKAAKEDPMVQMMLSMVKSKIGG